MSQTDNLILVKKKGVVVVKGLKKMPKYKSDEEMHNAWAGCQRFKLGLIDLKLRLR